MKINRRQAIINAAMAIGMSFACSGEVFWKGEWYDIQNAIDSGDVDCRSLGEAFRSGVYKSLFTTSTAEVAKKGK